MKDVSYDNPVMKTEPTLNELTAFYKLLGNGSRLAILLALQQGEDNVAGICSRTGLSQTLVSHQLAILHTHNVVRPRRDGRRTYYALADRHIETIIGYALEHLREQEGTS